MTYDSFELIAERALPHSRATGTVLRHRASGAQIVAVQNSDPEMVFGIILETLPARSNGVAHLLEHLTFRGSKRYPQTHMYAKLVQGTLLTGLNASTGADSTLFHLSSANRDDFSNLINVMLDAVFHPLLREADFLAERHVVMNEMAGHHAVPANRILERVRHELLAGSIYGVDHGGDPQMIATLTHVQLRDFHAQHYQPAKARLFLWGDFDLAQRLDQLDQSLGQALTTNAETCSALPVMVAPFPAPRHIDATYPAPENSPDMTGFGWAFAPDNADLWDAMALAMMAEPDGPVRQALQANGAGVIGPGFSKNTPLGTFEIALVGHLQNANARLIDALNQTVQTLLQDPAAEKWALKATERLEFKLRSFGSRAAGPTGLKALNLMRGDWHHGADPLTLLDIETRTADLRATIAADPYAMARQLGKNLLDNPHRVVVSMRPDCKKRTPNRTPPFPVMASDPTASGATNNLPFVSPHHVPSKIPPIATEMDGHVLHLTDLNTDLARAELAISLSGLNAVQIDLVPVLEMLLATRPAGDGMAITTRCWVGKQDATLLSIAGKSLPAQGAQMLRQLFGVLKHPLPTVDVLQSQIKAGQNALRSELAAFGHLFCETRLRANSGIAGALNERLVGFHRLQALDRAATRAPEGLLQELEALRIHLNANAEMTMAISRIAPILAQSLMQERSHAVPKNCGNQLFDLDKLEIIVTGAANFTTGQAVHLRETGPAHVAAHMLETGWLWDSVRVAGGAYSVRCNYGRDDGLMTMISIRDPSPRRTLQHFRQAPIWLNATAQGDDLARCVAAKMGHLTRPVRPDLALSTALMHHLCGQTDVIRQAELESVRRVTPAAMKQLAQSFEAGLEQAQTVILGPREGYDVPV